MRVFQVMRRQIAVAMDRNAEIDPLLLLKHRLLDGRQQAVEQLRIAHHILLRIGSRDGLVSGGEHHLGADAATVDRVVQQS